MPTNLQVQTASAGCLSAQFGEELHFIKTSWLPIGRQISTIASGQSNRDLQKAREKMNLLELSLGFGTQSVGFWLAVLLFFFRM